MPDFQFDGQPYEAPEAAADQTYAATPPSMGRAMGALFGESSSSEMLQRAGERGAYEGASIFDQMLYQSGAAQAGVDPTPIQTPTLSPDEYNKKYAPIGPDGKQVPLGDKPMPEGIAQLVGKAKTDEIEREGVLARFSNAHSAPVTFGAGMAAFMLDPLNVATTFLPGIGEETALAGLGRVGVTGIAARVGARVIAGGTAGTIAQAPVSALRYGLGTEEASDYGLRDAFRDMMFSAAGNAVMHAGLGTAADLIRGRSEIPVSQEAGAAPDPAATMVLQADAPTKADAMRAGISQVTDGRMVDVLPAFARQDIELLSREAALKARGTETDEFLKNLEVHPNAQAASDTLARVSEVERQLQDETISTDQRKALGERRDELLANTNPETLREQASTLELQRQAQGERSRIDEQLADIHGQRTQAAAETALSPLPKLAESQREIYQNGFAASVPQPEFDQFHNDIYGAEEPEETEQPKAEGDAQTETDKQLADAEAQLQASQRNGVEIHPEDQAELQRTEAGMQAADAKEQAIGEAASCLGGAAE